MFTWFNIRALYVNLGKILLGLIQTHFAHLCCFLRFFALYSKPRVTVVFIIFFSCSPCCTLLFNVPHLHYFFSRNHWKLVVKHSSRRAINSLYVKHILALLVILLQLSSTLSAKYPSSTVALLASFLSSYVMFDRQNF